MEKIEMTNERKADAFIASFWNNIPKQVRVTFVFAFFFTILAHMFMFTNKLPNTDDIAYSFNNLRWLNISGRWFTDFIGGFSSGYSIPWVIGCLSAFYLALACSLLIATLQIKNSVYCVIISALIIVFPSVPCIFSYMHISDTFFFALFLSCLAVFTTWKYRFGWILGAIFILLSLAIYQAFFPFAACIIICALLFQTIRNKETDKELILQTLRYFLCLALGMVGYLISVKITTANIELTPYQNIDKMGQIELSTLPNLIKNAYQNFSFFFLKNPYGLHTRIIRLGILFLFTLSGAGCIGLFIKNKTWKSWFRVIFAVALIILFPLSAGLIYVMAPDTWQHMITLYPFVMGFILAAGIADIASEIKTDSLAKNRMGLALKTISILFFFLLIFNYYVRANKMYFKLYYAYEQAYSYSTRLLERIESFPGYSDQRKVQFYGIPHINNERLMKELDVFPGIQSANDITMYYLHNFIIYYLGFTQVLPPGEKIVSNYDAMALPEYPAPGSIALIDNVIVVNFGFP